nr:immunoglobulin heavy chain junction region [Mus musculus]MBK4188071.1 immunoglobulin heavy chain junction region [Mus musculus]
CTRWGSPYWYFDVW